MMGDSDIVSQLNGMKDELIEDYDISKNDKVESAGIMDILGSFLVMGFSGLVEYLKKILVQLFD